MGVAQIVITAATPMIEEAEHAFPPVENTSGDIADEQTQQDDRVPAQDGATDFELAGEDVMTNGAISEHRDEEEDDGFEDGDRAPENEPAFVCQDDGDDQPDSAQYPASSSTEGDCDTTGPSTADNSISNVHMANDDTELKQVIGGRASIPDELEPHQLARLQDLKESNA